jgi:hypothetical protein
MERKEGKNGTSVERMGNKNEGNCSLEKKKEQRDSGVRRRFMEEGKEGEERMLCGNGWD